MRILRSALPPLVVLCAVTLMHPPAAHAYLDPGTGSIIAQAVLAGIVGVATAAKLYWAKIRGLFKAKH